MKFNYHSTENQRVLSKLVQREVLHNQTPLVDWLRRNHFEDVEFTNLYIDKTEEIKELVEQRDEKDWELEDLQETLATLECDVEQSEEELEEAEEELKEKSYWKSCCQVLTAMYTQKYLNKEYKKTEEKIAFLEEELKSLEDELDDLRFRDGEINPVYEWWLVTPFFESRLKDYGETFMEFEGETWWGRGCSGQAVLLDTVIGSIGEDMEILEGQRNHKYWTD